MHSPQGDEKKLPSNYQVKTKSYLKIQRQQELLNLLLVKMERRMTYKVEIKEIDKVTMAQIQQGKIGENGPVVVTLFIAHTPTDPKDGLLAQGSVTSDKLEGPLKGKQISDLVKLIENGNAYSNIHTEQNPKGEIRGQTSKWS